MQYCILGTCTYSPSIVPRIYLPPTCEPASLSGPSTSRGTSSGVAWPLGLARRHLNPVMPSCHRIDDFQSRQSPQREAVSSWSIGDFRAMPYLGPLSALAQVTSRDQDIRQVLDLARYHLLSSQPTNVNNLETKVEFASTSLSAPRPRSARSRDEISNCAMSRSSSEIGDAMVFLCSERDSRRE